MINNEERDEAAKKYRKKFITKAYAIFALCVISTIAQWCLIMLSSRLKLFLITHVELCIVAFFVAVLLIAIFVFVENVRLLTPLNVILAITIVECLIISIARIIIVTCYAVIGISLLLVLVPLIMCILIASCVKHDFTLDVIILFILSYICFVAAVYFATLHVVGGAIFAYEILTSIIFLVVCIFVMYHTQTINGGRYAEMRLTDYILASLTLYIDFLILYMVATYSVKLVWVYYLRHDCNKYAFVLAVAAANRPYFPDNGNYTHL